MNIWLISQKKRHGHGVYGSAVVSAKSEDDARRICPCTNYVWSEKKGCWMYVYASGRREPEANMDMWVSHIDDVEVELLGQGKLALDGPGLILATQGLIC